MKKPEPATKMVDHALERVKPGDTARKETLLLLALKQEVVDFAAAIKRPISRISYHFGNIPVEILHGPHPGFDSHRRLQWVAFCLVLSHWPALPTGPR
jgi:hypothetical protein